VVGPNRDLVYDAEDFEDDEIDDDGDEDVMEDDDGTA